MEVLVSQSCPTLCSPMDYSPPGSSGHGIFQAKYWSGLPFPLQGVFPPQGSKPPLLHLLHWLVGSLPAAPPGKPKYLNKAVKNNLFIRINRECQIVSIICRNKCSEAHPKYRCLFINYMHGLKYVNMHNIFIFKNRM